MGNQQLILSGGGKGVESLDVILIASGGRSNNYDGYGDGAGGMLALANLDFKDVFNPLIPLTFNVAATQTTTGQNGFNTELILTRIAGGTETLTALGGGRSGSTGQTGTSGGSGGGGHSSSSGGFGNPGNGFAGPPRQGQSGGAGWANDRVKGGGGGYRTEGGNTPNADGPAGEGSNCTDTPEIWLGCSDDSPYTGQFCFGSGPNNRFGNVLGDGPGNPDNPGLLAFRWDSSFPDPSVTGTHTFYDSNDGLLRIVVIEEGEGTLVWG